MNKLLIFDDAKINFKKTICILILIMIFSGIFGFIYETIFYRIDLGYFVKRGSTFGPWIPIYAFGSLLITLFSYKFRNRPLVVFLISCVITSLIEYITGFVLFEFMHIRLWDYNTEMLNFGNINGYICLRSILFFAISSLFLIYVVIPFIKNIASKMNERLLVIISSILGGLFLCDMILHAILK